MTRVNIPCFLTCQVFLLDDQIDHVSQINLASTYRSYLTDQGPPPREPPPVSPINIKTPLPDIPPGEEDPGKHDVMYQNWAGISLVLAVLGCDTSMVLAQDSMLTGRSVSIAFICAFVWIHLLTPNVQGLSYLSLTGSISWLLMAWLLVSPGRQQPWYWLYKISKSWSNTRMISIIFGMSV